MDWSTNRNRLRTIQSRYILMPVSMLVRCEKCGYQNFPQHRFCGMCAAELRLPGPGRESASAFAGASLRTRSCPASIPAASFPPARSFCNPCTSAKGKGKEEAVTTQKVSGPSFLGLGSEPADSSTNLSYLLEDEPPQHRVRNFMLIVLFAALAVPAWHWRQDLRVVAVAIS